MKIVKKSERIASLPLNLACRECSSILEIEEADVYASAAGDFYFDCPLCNATTEITHIFDIETTKRLLTTRIPLGKIVKLKTPIKDFFYGVVVGRLNKTSFRIALVDEEEIDDPTLVRNVEKQPYTRVKVQGDQFETNL